MKKFGVAIMAVMIAVAFAGAVFAAVGHVGHVNTDDYQEVDPGVLIFDPPEINANAIISPPSIDSGEVNMGELGTYDIILLAGIKAYFDGPVSGELTISLNGGNLDPDGFLIFNHTTGVYDYFPLVNGEVTIQDGSDYVQPDGVTSGMDPSVSNYSAEVFLVNAEKETPSGGGGGGGCSLGMLSPFALLLAVPLVLLRK